MARAAADSFFTALFLENTKRSRLSSENGGTVETFRGAVGGFKVTLLKMKQSAKSKNLQQSRNSESICHVDKSVFKVTWFASFIEVWLLLS